MASTHPTIHAFTSFTAQTWHGDTHIVPDFDGLSIDAAREIARTHAAMGYTGRIMAEDVDYCEVYEPDGSVRRGRFAQVTLVHVARAAR